jgi:hypothetical protein
VRKKGLLPSLPRSSCDLILLRASGSPIATDRFWNWRGSGIDPKLPVDLLRSGRSTPRFTGAPSGVRRVRWNRWLGIKLHEHGCLGPGSRSIR